MSDSIGAHLSAVSAQPADTLPAPISASGAQPERELFIRIWRDEHAQFEGTAAQLIAEGLIPDGFQWPLSKNSVEWQAGRHTYWLRRKRPSDHKGPMRSWLTMDYWFVRVGVVGRDSRWSEKKRLADSIKEMAYRNSSKGFAEQEARLRRYMASMDDKGFQAFKDKVPGLARAKRCRQPVNTAQGAQQ